MKSLYVYTAALIRESSFVSGPDADGIHASLVGSQQFLTTAIGPVRRVSEMESVNAGYFNLPCFFRILAKEIGMVRQWAGIHKFSKNLGATSKF